MTTPRERIRRTLNGQVPDRAPFSFYLCPLQQAVCERETGTRDHAAYFDFDVKRASASPTARRTDFSRFFPQVPPNARFSEWGAMHVPSADTDYHYTHRVPPMADFTSVEQIESYPFPDVDADYRYADVRAAARGAHDAGYAFGTGFNLGPVHTTWTLRGMDRFMVEAAGDEPFMRALFEKVVSLQCAEARLLASAHPEIIYNGDNFATQRGLMVSRQFWRDWYGAAHRRIIEAIHSVDPGIRYFFHADGMMQEMIPEMISIGVDILDPIQPECMDPAEIKRRYGDRLVLSGGISIQQTLPFGTCEEVKNEVKLRMETVGRGGGYLLAPAHVIQPEVPWRNVLAFVEAARTYGRYDGQ